MCNDNHECSGEFCDDDGNITQITITLDDGSELDCEVLIDFHVDGVEYISLITLPADKNEEEEILLFRYEIDDNGELELVNIESDEEFERVEAVFQTLFEEDDSDDD